MSKKLSVESEGNKIKNKKLFHEFAERVFSDGKNYDYIILTTKRCYRLFFSVYFEDREYFDEKYSGIIDKIFSNQSINFIKNIIKDKNVLLVDDVMIHGRAVLSIFEELKNLKVSSVDTLVLARNYEIPDFYYKKTNQNYDTMYLMTRSDWYKISNEIVDYFSERENPYTSYLYDFSYLSNSTVKLDDLIDDFEDLLVDNGIDEVNIDDEKRNYINKLSGSKFFNHKCYFLNLSEEENRNSIIDEFVLRVQEYSTRTIIIPCCRINAVKSDSLKLSWVNICRICKPFSIYKDISAEDIYKIYTAIFSFSIFNIDKLKKAIKNNLIHPSLEIDKSYYKNCFYDILDFIDFVNSNVSGNTLLSKVLSFFTQEDYFLDIVSGELEVKKLYLNLIEKYQPYNNDYKNISLLIHDINSTEELNFVDSLKSEGVIEEKLSNYYQDDNSISSRVFYEKTGINKDNELKTFAILLLGTGSFAHFIKEHTNTKEQYNYVDTSVRTGEQSFRLSFIGEDLSYYVAARYTTFYKFLNSSFFSIDDIKKFIKYLKKTYKDNAKTFSFNSVERILIDIYHKKELYFAETLSALFDVDKFRDDVMILNQLVLDYFNIGKQ